MSSVILLVDDNAIQATTRKAILERAGRRVVVATDGPGALELLSDPVERVAIGLIVTDHLMPGMNGPELVAEIRKMGIELPVVVLSGLPDAEQAYADADLKVIFRLKPFSPDLLIQLSNDLLCQKMSRTA